MMRPVPALRGPRQRQRWQNQGTKEKNSPYHIRYTFPRSRSPAVFTDCGATLSWWLDRHVPDTLAFPYCGLD